jgi:hypothetical protein
MNTVQGKGPPFPSHPLTTRQRVSFGLRGSIRNVVDWCARLTACSFMMAYNRAKSSTDHE